MTLPAAMAPLAGEAPAPRGAKIELFDKNVQPLCPITGYTSVKFDVRAIDNGTARIVVDPDKECAQILLLADVDTTHFATITTDTYRWEGVVAETHLQSSNGIVDCVIDLDDVRKVAASVSCWRDPNASGSGQPKDAQAVSGQCVSLARSVLQANLNRMGATSIVLAPAPLADSSATVTVDLDFHTFGETFADAFKQAGVAMHAKLWVPGDPQPTGMGLIAPTIVVAILDHNAYSGFADARDMDPVTQYLQLITGQGFQPSPWPLRSPLYGEGFQGTDPVDPWVIWRLDGPGIASFDLTCRRASGHTVALAARNDDYGTQKATEIANGTPLASPALAVTTLSDDARKNTMGSMIPGEVAVTQRDFVDEATALYAMRGTYALKVDVIDRVPYAFGRNFDIGSPVAFQIPGFAKRYHDVCTSAEYSDSMTDPDKWTLGFGWPDLDPPAVDAAKRAARLEKAMKTSDLTARL